MVYLSKVVCQYLSNSNNTHLTQAMLTSNILMNGNFDKTENDQMVLKTMIFPTTSLQGSLKPVNDI